MIKDYNPYNCDHPNNFLLLMISDFYLQHV
jgi:hypothetical protein